jgi:hypothetical protein
MSEARINRISNEKGDGGPSISGITTFSGLNYFVPPKGTTAERPSDCPPGSIRFNTDSAHLEYFDGLQWLEFEGTNNELGVNGALGTRGVFAGGYGFTPTPAIVTGIEYITLSTLGDGITFGELTVGTFFAGAGASSTRGIFGGGRAGGQGQNVINYITFSSTANAIDFGDLTVARQENHGFSNAVRGLFAGGYRFSPNAYVNIIDYVTIASTGDAQDFGDLSFTGGYKCACASSTRGVTADSGNTLEYVTISSTGNAIDFGDLNVSLSKGTSCSNSTRGLFAAGLVPGVSNLIDFITIASTGNATDFGDLTISRHSPAAASSATRGVFSGGFTPSGSNVIDCVSILTAGNAIDFGDLVRYGGRRAHTACSNGHGGL